MGGLWAGLFIILSTLVELWPDGKFIHFREFIIKMVVSYLFVGFLFGLLMWIYGEYTYKKAINKPANIA